MFSSFPCTACGVQDKRRHRFTVTDLRKDQMYWLYPVIVYTSTIYSWNFKGHSIPIQQIKICMPSDFMWKLAHMLDMKRNLTKNLAHSPLKCIYDQSIFEAIIINLHLIITSITLFVYSDWRALIYYNVY